MLLTLHWRYGGATKKHRLQIAYQLLFQRDVILLGYKIINERLYF